MVTDRREYIRLDVGYFDNPKVGDAFDESPLAVILHIASMAYARQHRTDGVVPIKRLLRKVGATENDARILLEAGLWVDARGGQVRVHDYAKHQETKEQIEARTNAARKANRARWNTNPIPIGSEPDSEPDPIGNPEERRGEERRTSGGRPGNSTTERDVAATLDAAGLPPNEHKPFLQALKDGGIRKTPGYVVSAHRDGTLVARIKEWQDERDRAARAPRVLQANVTKTPGGVEAALNPELCPHDFEIGRCPKCRAEEGTT